MHVVFYLSKFYDWATVPRDVVVTPEDVNSGRVMPDRGGGYRTRVAKTPKDGTHRIFAITEADIVGKIIHEKTDVRRAGRTFTRKEAIAHMIMDHLSEGEFEWSWITKVEVHDDGPDEKLFRDIVEPHTKADHGRRLGQKNIDPKTVEAHVVAYTEPCDHAGHVTHLSNHFGVKVLA
jgi:hypothetical protein